VRYPDRNPDLAIPVSQGLVYPREKSTHNPVISGEAHTRTSRSGFNLIPPPDLKPLPSVPTQQFHPAKSRTFTPHFPDPITAFKTFPTSPYHPIPFSPSRPPLLHFPAPPGALSQNPSHQSPSSFFPITSNRHLWHKSYTRPIPAHIKIETSLAPRTYRPRVIHHQANRQVSFREPLISLKSFPTGQSPNSI